jgi:hypothetical protein
MNTIKLGESHRVRHVCDSSFKGVVTAIDDDWITITITEGISVAVIDDKLSRVGDTVRIRPSLIRD